MIIFTSDIDWAPDWAIKRMFDLFDEFNVPLHVFATHKSKLLSEYVRKYPERVGIHPNLAKNSTQGKNDLEILELLLTLYPKANSMRSHCYNENSQFLELCREKGILYDCNLYLNRLLIEPFRHGHGLVRFSTYWEDGTQGPFTVELLNELLTELQSGNIYIFNVHPMSVFLNIPDYQYYIDRKFLYTKYWDNNLSKRCIYESFGLYSFLEELLKSTKSNHQFRSLSEVYGELYEK